MTNPSCFPIFLLTICFLFSLAVPKLLNFDNFLKPQLIISPTFSAFSNMKNWNSGSNGTISAKTFLITSFNKSFIGSATNNGPSTGFLENIKQIPGKFGKIPYSDNRFDNFSQVDEYLYNLILENRSRRTINTSSTIQTLFGAFDIKNLNDQIIDYTLMSEGANANP